MRGQVVLGGQLRVGGIDGGWLEGEMRQLGTRMLPNWKVSETYLDRMEGLN